MYSVGKIRGIILLEYDKGRERKVYLAIANCIIDLGSHARVLVIITAA